MKRKFLVSIIAAVFAVSFTVVSKNIVKANTTPVTPVGVSYSGHVQNIGWQNPVSNGTETGTNGQGLRVEALKLNLTNAPANAHIQYQAHVQDIGWQKWVSDGQEAGTDGKSLRVEALKIKLQNMPGYSVQYRAHVQNIGWQDWVSDGQEAGTDGKSLRVEALEVRIVKISDNSTVGVSYVGHVQNVGWQDPVENGQIAGTEGQGLRVEALKMNLVNAPTDAHIKYQTHVQNIGWQNPVEDGSEGGTDGKGLRVEAIKIALENMPGYSVQYRAHVENIGWQPWVSDGAEAGTDGKGLRVEAIEVRIVKTSDGSTPTPVNFEPTTPSGSNTQPVNPTPGPTVPTNTGYTAPLPNPKYITIKPISQCPQRVSTAPNSEYIIVKDGKYVSPNDTDSPAARAYNNTATGNRLVSADLSDVVDVNMHGGYSVARSPYGAYEEWYALGEKDMENTRAVINANYQDQGYGTIAEPANFKVLGVYAESTTLNSNDVTKLTAAASTLHTQFMTSGYDPDVTYEHYSVVYDTVNKTNVITRFVVYSEKIN